MGETKRIGIVGAGNVSKMHLEGIARHPGEVKVAGICDPSPETLKERAGEFGVGQTYSGLEEMIEGLEMDAAIVCAPTHIRQSVIAPLVNAGIPVLCEKPFAETYAEAKGITELSVAKKTPIAINQNFRRHFCLHLAKEVLQSGRLGRPLHLTQVEQYLRIDQGWRNDRDRYIMSVMSIHWFDGYRYIFGEEPESVYCRSVNAPATPGKEDTAVSAVLHFPSGIMASLSDSFTSFTGKQVCTLDCEKGGLILDYGKLVEIGEDKSTREHENPYDKLEATYWVLADLLDSVEKGKAPETSAQDNLKSMRVMEAAYVSMKEKRVVKIEEIE